MDELYMRPGVLFRRAHQIAVGVFMHEAAALKLTPPQHSILFTIDRCPALNQSEVARALGFDRATTGQIIAGLEARGLIKRSPSATSRRKNALYITTDGVRLLSEAEEPSRRSSKRLLSPLSTSEQRQLMGLVAKLTTALNDESRTPLTPIAPGEN
ncbi:MarR family winged helix-turn-helix transcriptional regulator [Pigmentiphaga sp. NML080357]|uniref:MarR family winged helix-turn-helix transcriptional regulator n=1 Tax=Pigmentiphaga sp. NML080357 TaxID=2008675 RepID=UPI0013030B3A|nr:MarR family transcriptional regulator [Pigmentiphaga sp. NML080357]